MKFIYRRHNWYVHNKYFTVKEFVMSLCMYVLINRRIFLTDLSC